MFRDSKITEIDQRVTNLEAEMKTINFQLTQLLAGIQLTKWLVGIAIAALPAFLTISAVYQETAQRNQTEIIRQLIDEHLDK